MRGKYVYDECKKKKSIHVVEWIVNFGFKFDVISECEPRFLEKRNFYLNPFRFLENYIILFSFAIFSTLSLWKFSFIRVQMVNKKELVWRLKRKIFPSRLNILVAEAFLFFFFSYFVTFSLFRWNIKKTVIRTLESREKPCTIFLLEFSFIFYFYFFSSFVSVSFPFSL